MSFSRNRSRKLSRSSKDKFKKGAADKYITPKFRKILDEERQQYTTKTMVWKSGDRLYKYAAKHYGEEAYWWLIAWFNNKPTESHFKEGDLFAIPSIDILNFLKYE